MHGIFFVKESGVIEQPSAGFLGQSEELIRWKVRENGWSKCLLSLSYGLLKLLLGGINCLSEVPSNTGVDACQIVGLEFALPKR